MTELHNHINNQSAISCVSVVCSSDMKLLSLLLQFHIIMKKQTPHKADFTQSRLHVMKVKNEGAF